MSFSFRLYTLLFLILILSGVAASNMVLADTATTSVNVVAVIGECNDGVDNDSDGLTDNILGFEDPGCYDNGDVDTGVYVATNTEATQLKPLCDDGADNDFDGLEDYPADLGCEDLLDDDEVNPQCVDGIDNDGDGKIDFPADDGCDTANDDDETNITSGSNSTRVGDRGLPSNFEDLSLVTLGGYGEPGAQVSILADGMLLGIVVVGTDGVFEITIENITPGAYNFALYVTDTNGLLSGTVPISTTILPDTHQLLENIVLPPTLTFVSPGDAGNDSVTVSGNTYPEALVELLVTASDGIVTTVSIIADVNGSYTFTFAVPGYELGEYGVTVRAIHPAGYTSVYGRSVDFDLGGAFIIDECRDAVFDDVDFNADGRVNIVDASILTFWYNKVSGESRFDLNCSQTVDIVDLSILAYWWTG